MNTQEQAAFDKMREALDASHGFVEFLWREVSMNDWASNQRDLLEHQITAALAAAKVVADKSAPVQQFKEEGMYKWQNKA